MNVGKNMVVTIDYTLKDSAGEILDTSKGEAPLVYIHGTGNLIPGLEAALEGKTAGTSLHVSISPADGYGERDEKRVQRVPRARFEKAKNLKVGMQFVANTNDGEEVVTVTHIDNDAVTVDSNHPLAGVTLNFDVSVVDVRMATAEELSHGHVHGPDGHHH